MRRLYIEQAGPVVLVKRQVYHPETEWTTVSTNVYRIAGKIVAEGVDIVMWIKARFKSQCNEKDCGKTIEIGDRCFIDGGRMLCEEHGEAEQETERTGEEK